jgi:hypothetical protein
MPSGGAVRGGRTARDDRRMMFRAVAGVAIVGCASFLSIAAAPSGEANVERLRCGWRVAPTGITQRRDVLRGVVARSQADVWAVGVRGIGSRGGRRSLVLRWNGSDWRQVSSPKAGDVDDFNELRAVAMTPRGGWAVGHRLLINRTSIHGSETLILA